MVVESTNPEALYAYEFNTIKTAVSLNITFSQGTTDSGMTYASWSRSVNNGTSTAASVYIIAYKGAYFTTATFVSPNGGIASPQVIAAGKSKPP